MTSTLLQGFVTEQVRRSVVRVKDPEADPDSVCTGFFIDPSGYLVTAFHSMKHRFLAPPERFRLTIEFDLSDSPATATRPTESAITVDAYTNPQWCDSKADWAVFKLDFNPATYLPLHGSRNSETWDDLASRELYVFGYTATDQSSVKRALFKGNYVRHITEKRRHHISYVVRAEGQSGGPVMDMTTGEIIGSVVGYREREVLTGEAAELSQQVLGRLDLGIDFAALAYEWHARAATYISARNTTFALLADELAVPELPPYFLRDRELVNQVATLLLQDQAPSVFLHGTAASGKTSVCIEAAQRLAARNPDASTLRYDFAVARNRSISMFVQGLAMHLLLHKSCFEPITECLEPGFALDHSQAVRELLDALRSHRVIMILENLHALSEVDTPDLVELLISLESAAGMGSSRILFNSRHAALPGIAAPTIQADGFTAREIADFLNLYDIDLDQSSLAKVAKFGSNILCIEEVARTPEWRDRVLTGFGATSATESLHRYWLENYSHISSQERDVLLAVAVLDRPVSRRELEEISAVQGFSATLDQLQRNPPLIRVGTDGYYVHSDTKVAVTSSSDLSDVSAIRLRAAQVCTRGGKVLEGARLFLQSSVPEDALEALYQNRENLIAGGSVDELEQVLVGIVGEAERDSALRQSMARRLNILQAGCSTMRGEYDVARRHWTHAVQTAQDTAEKAALLRRLGDSCRLASDYDAAIEHYRLAASLLEGTQDYASLTEFAWASLGLGKLDRLRADYDRALRRYTDARDSYSRLFDRTGLAEAEFGIGEVSRLQGAYSASEVAYRASLDHADSIDNLERRAYALWGIGEVCRLTDRFKEALEHHRAGLELCLQLGDRRSEGWALLGIGQVEFADGRTVSARAAYDEALARFEQTRSNTEIAHAKLSLAELHSAAGEVDLKLYDEADERYRKLNLRHCVVQNSLAKAMALRRLGRRREANALLKQAQRLALQCSLTAELRVIESVRRDSAKTPQLTLNFP